MKKLFLHLQLKSIDSGKRKKEGRENRKIRKPGVRPKGP